jgi:hypothetical protein
MKTMMLAAAAVLALGVGSVAYAESEGDSAAGEMWQARNGNATVPATEWFAATPAQREVLSHQYPAQPILPPNNYAGQTPSHG